MNKLALALAAFVVFTAYTLSVAAQHSLLGFLADHARGGWSLQVFLDLCVAAASFWVVALPDARARGIRAWPYAVLTPVLGSVAILAYFVHREVRARATARAMARG
jgi:hypothetical protein